MIKTQEETLEILKGPGNVFLTGSPGTGKSYVIGKYIDWLDANNKSYVVTASTGIAAMNVLGTTIHSFLGVGNKGDDIISDEDIVDILTYKGKPSFVCKGIRDTNIIIIDEISMMSEQLFVNMNKILQMARNSSDIFGGIKMVCVGDFFQLAPVKGEYAFSAYEWTKAKFINCYLTKNYRQDTDNVFIEVLTAVRNNTLTEKEKAVIRGRVFEDVSNTGCSLRLYTHNVDVDDINLKRLARIQEPVHIFEMESKGEESLVKILKGRNKTVPEKLLLKVGAPVIFVKNDQDQQWVNGSQGVVDSFDKDVVIVRMTNGSAVRVSKTSWGHTTGFGENRTTKASISQIPLRLAWAITIHKSQGMTLDSAIIDVTKAFADGHGYVALSRIRSLNNVFIQGTLSSKSFEVSHKVLEKDKEFLYE